MLLYDQHRILSFLSLGVRFADIFSIIHDFGKNCKSFCTIAGQERQTVYFSRFGLKFYGSTDDITYRYIRLCPHGIKEAVSCRLQETIIHNTLVSYSK